MTFSFKEEIARIRKKQEKEELCDIKKESTLPVVKVLNKDGSIKEVKEVGADYKLEQNEQYGTDKDWVKDQKKKLGDQFDKAVEHVEIEDKKGAITVEKEIEINQNIIKVILKEKYIEFIKSDKVVNRFKYREIDNKLIGNIAIVLVDANCFENKKEARVWIQDNELFNNLSNLKTLLDIRIEKSRLSDEEFKIEDSIMVFNNDYVEMAKKFWLIQPYYYDKSNIWWLWNFREKFWEMIDEVDLMNKLRDNASPFLNVTQGNCFSQIVHKSKYLEE